MDDQDKRIPVTLLTGFLGAGKTTLLNHLISDPDAGRVAVIMNEFGSAGLDHDLIEESTEETILMQSGCLCCTFRGDVSKTLESLMARRKQGELRFDRVVIETTGIADPGPILHTLVVDDLVASSYRMDGVITLADAATGANTLDHHAEAVNQIAMADLIVLTKSDLVAASDLARYEARVEGINGSAQRVYAKHGHVPSGVLFGLSAMRGDVTSDEAMEWLGAAMAKTDPLAGPSGVASEDVQSASLPHSDTNPQTRHDHGINSASIEVEDPIPASVFDFWLDTLMALKGPDILRMKGIVHIEGMDRPLAFHGVQHIFDTPVVLESWSGKDTTSRVVVIARHVEKADLEASLKIMRMRPKDIGPYVDDMVANATETAF